MARTAGRPGTRRARLGRAVAAFADGGGWTVREVPTPAGHPTGWVANHAVATGRDSVYVPRQDQRPAGARGHHGRPLERRPLTVAARAPFDEANAAGADGAGRLWIGGWAPGGGPHSLMARWTGTRWATEELSAGVTGHSGMSTVFGIAGVPGTKGVFAAGTAGCASDPVLCGIVVSRDLR
ncbi:hypothetical protein ACI2L4_36440 [Streptomyces sparsogenes]|uniref:hypothetical protein n=1 Tax=Streptomyces sparsogenes TaxID=67365 RepID=UPI00384B96D3